ncbi:MAG: hypothetical protein CM15mP58_19380 [Burkholderiaceae bacterium]|nr:MAG: hypothetical protein CM15mP58_19380 [Burkholderiaceae bacterium]
MPHFHIPLQSGSNKILKLMRRRYTSSQYAESISLIRQLIPDASIGVDVIVGFLVSQTKTLWKHLILLKALIFPTYMFLLILKEKILMLQILKKAWTKRLERIAV